MRNSVNRNAEIRAAIDHFEVERARDLLRLALEDAPDAETYYLASMVAANNWQRDEFLRKAQQLDPFHEDSFWELEHESEGDALNQKQGFVPQASMPAEATYESSPSSRKKSRSLVVPMAIVSLVAVLGLGAFIILSDGGGSGDTRKATTNSDGSAQIGNGVQLRVTSESDGNSTADMQIQSLEQGDHQLVIVSDPERQYASRLLLVGPQATNSRSLEVQLPKANGQTFSVDRIEISGTAFDVRQYPIIDRVSSDELAERLVDLGPDRLVVQTETLSDIPENIEYGLYESPLDDTVFVYADTSYSRRTASLATDLPNNSLVVGHAYLLVEFLLEGGQGKGPLKFVGDWLEWLIFAEEAFEDRLLGLIADCEGSRRVCNHFRPFFFTVRYPLGPSFGPMTDMLVSSIRCERSASGGDLVSGKETEICMLIGEDSDDKFYWVAIARVVNEEDREDLSQDSFMEDWVSGADSECGQEDRLAKAEIVAIYCKDQEGTLSGGIAATSDYQYYAFVVVSRHCDMCFLDIANGLSAQMSVDWQTAEFPEYGSGYYQSQR